MGILIPLNLFILKRLDAFDKSKKPSWAMTDIDKRALRYANTFQRNYTLLQVINPTWKPTQARAGV